MPFSERELLAKLVKCEAGGEGENGMKAVANVVINRARVPNGEYSRVSEGGNIRNIIFQPGQFDCAMETIGGKYNPQNLFNMNPEQIHYDIADWAIAGNKLPGFENALWFYNPYSQGCKSNFPSSVGYNFTKLGNHCFYNPTNDYSRT